jgi:hypothetical protein
MVRRAADYLDSSFDSRVGGRCLLGMALLKAGRDEDHELIRLAVEDCRKICENPDSIDGRLDIYETAVAAIFLCELDPQRFRDQIQALITSLHARQKPFGGWGYPRGESPTEAAEPDPAGVGNTSVAERSDTSMTQYGVLASWVAHRSGAAAVSPRSMERVLRWLMRTQDPSGAWGYQGRLPPPRAEQRVRQSQIRHSLCAAGAGSVYILADFLGLTEATIRVQVGNEQLPPALRPVATSAELPAGDEVSPQGLQAAMRDADQWFQSNYRIDPEEWAAYYLYALERYRSFQELAQGRVRAEPSWYNDGVRFLRRQQSELGSWNLNGGGTAIDTAFCILFLKRSTQKAIQRMADRLAGRLSGGRGLPTNVTRVSLKDGQIVRTPFQGTADALLTILENADHPDLEAASQDPRVTFPEDAGQRGRQLARMRGLVNAPSPEVRLAAVRALATVRELDSVPVLIFALDDPDTRVARAARDGLRFISRKFGGFGLTFPAEAGQRQRAIAAWKQWYATIRPDAMFLE